MAIQQTDFNGKMTKKSQICTLLEKCKETNLEFYKGTEKVLQA